MNRSRKNWVRAVSFIMSLMILQGTAAAAAMTAYAESDDTAQTSEQQSGIKLVSVTAEGSRGAYITASFDNSYSELVQVAEAGVKVNGTKLAYNSNYSYISSAEVGECIVSGSTVQFYTASLNEGENTVTFTVPDGEDVSVCLKMSKSGDYWSGYTYTVETVSGGSEQTGGEEQSALAIDLKDVCADSDNSLYTVASFGNDYAELSQIASAGVVLNGTKLNYNSSYSSLYYVNKGDCIVTGNTIQFHSSLLAEGDNTLTFKSPDGGEDKSVHVTMSKVEVPPKYWYESTSYDYVVELAKDEPQEEPPQEQDQQLFVRIVGGFEHKIVGQQDDVDAVSSATTGSASYISSSSSAHVEFALTEKGTALEDVPEEAWDKPDYFKNGDLLQVDGAKSEIVISPECDGVYGEINQFSGDLFLRGVPEKAGRYKVSVHLVTDKGEAYSNEVDYIVYSGEEKLIDQLTYDNCVQTADGKYMFDNEPWNMKTFGGENETVTVPKDIKAWYGSHAVLPEVNYGEIGVTAALSDGEETSQTLIIPEGCNLTMVNMKVHSGVKIVVENGAKLTLRQTTVEGIVEVENGGTFSMDYNDYGSGEWLHGSMINGQLRMKDGSVLENARITAHGNYLAETEDDTRRNFEPVVVTEGSVTVKGDVYILGEEAPSGENGQPALRVSGTLNVPEGSVLACYGGGTSMLTADGGDAIQLDNGSITGEGSVIAIGGYGMNITGDTSKGSGGAAVSGKGTVAVAKAYLEGGSSFHEGAEALEGDVTVAGTTARKIVSGKGETTEKSEFYWFGTGDANGIVPQVEATLAQVPENAPADEEKESIKITYTTGSGSAELSWNAVKGAEKYAVCGYVNGRWQILSEGEETSYKLDGLKAGNEYKVAVIAKINGSWNYDVSNAVTISAKTEVSFPVLTVRAENNRFLLDWTKVEGAEKYGIAVFISGKWKVQAYTDADVTSFVSPKLGKGTYKMVVCAKVNGKWDLRSISARAVEGTI